MKTEWNWNNVLFRSGDLFLPKPVRDVLEYYYIGNDKTLFYVTNWTIIHFLTGLWMASYLKSNPNYANPKIYLIAFLIHTLWELWQIYGGNTPIRTLRGAIDVFTDTAAFMLGVYVYLRS
jgi:hypothetical protein